MDADDPAARDLSNELGASVAIPCLSPRPRHGATSALNPRIGQGGVGFLGVIGHDGEVSRGSQGRCIGQPSPRVPRSSRSSARKATLSHRSSRSCPLSSRVASNLAALSMGSSPGRGDDSCMGSVGLQPGFRARELTHRGSTLPRGASWPGSVRSIEAKAGDVAPGQHGRLITCINRGAAGAGPVESIADVRDHVPATGVSQEPSGGITASRGFFFLGCCKRPVARPGPGRSERMPVAE